MEFDDEKIDEMVLALLYLTLHDGNRAWKSHAWEVTNRLFQKGLIYDPAGKAKSFGLTEEGLKQCEALFKKHFAK